jgi:hypothetical protein
MANRRRDVDKERFWRDVLRRQAASGLSVRAFCRREKLTESAFYAWRRIVAERNTEVKPTRQASAFVPMTVIEPSARQASIEIELAGGRLLRLPSTISVEWLAELVRALEGRAAR